MVREETTGKKPKPAAGHVKRKRGLAPLPTAMFSIRGFCIAHGISESMYFKLRDLGQGPREMRLGARVFVTHESASRWRMERESATAAAE